MSDFFPKGYSIPSTSSGGKYMKFQEGENRYRVLSNPIVGYEYWTVDNKPVRSKEPFATIPKDARLDDGQFKAKHFWANVVWNYSTESVQILEITQKSIQNAIMALTVNEKWGDPKKYDLAVTKKGKGLDTEYSVVAEPPTALTKKMTVAYNDTPVDLNALYAGADPFNSSKETKEGYVYPKDDINADDVPF